jgi:endoglucanase
MDGTMPETFELIKTLTELPGPVGHEDAVQDWIANRWGAFAEVRRTKVDNVIAKVGGSGRRLALMAHSDEICFMTKSITDDGFLHIWPYSSDTRGHPPRWVMPLNQPVLVVTSTGFVEGVFATASGHVVGNRDNVNARYEWNDWFIDIGAASCDEARAMGVRPGARVIWNPPTRRIGSTHIVGKAMDDRVALAIATLAGEALATRDDLAYEVWLVSTVQEENGLIGASSVHDEVQFDRCVNLDVGLTGDIPGPDKRDFPVKLGAGPTVVYQDASVHYSRRMSDELVAVAENAGIPVQQAIFQSYGSDGAPLIRRGVETALLTYPTRYTHSPIETVDERDIEACVDLLAAFATTPERAS